jgi:hypothetical protein
MLIPVYHHSKGIGFHSVIFITNIAPFIAQDFRPVNLVSRKSRPGRVSFKEANRSGADQSFIISMVELK